MLPLEKNDLKKWIVHYSTNNSIVQPNKVPVTVEEENMEVEEEEEESSDDNWNCADSEIKDDLDSAIAAIFEENSDRFTRERFHFILQMLLTDPEFLSEDYLLMS